MHKRRLGSDGPEVSAIGIGALSFAGFYGPSSEVDANAVFETALDLGIDHIDTANVYGAGLSERMIGSFLKQRGGDSPFRIATKAGLRRDPDTGERSIDNSPAHLRSELEGSLARLGVEAVDLFYVHRRDPEYPIEEVTETLAGFVSAGKIKAFGFSEIAPSSLRRAAAIHPVAAVQSEYSLSVRAPELGMVQACVESGTALVAFSPVGRGMLTDTPPDAARVAEAAFLSASPRFAEPHLSANLQLTDRFRGLSAEMGVSAAALSIAWLLHRSENIIPVPGTRSPRHLTELAAGTELALSAGDLQRIEDILPVGWAHGDRYSETQWVGSERYC